MEKGIAMERDFDTDFHIHTPASKCYCLNREVEEDSSYKDLISKVHSSGVKIAFVTDHNTIKGYRKILDIRAQIIQEIAFFEKMFEKIGDIPDKGRIEYDELIRLSTIFDEVSFFPGIEFTTKEQIHMLILFDRDLDLELIDDFLFQGGYPPEHQGMEDATSLANWTVTDLLEVVPTKFGNKALILGAHVDREKGLWESLEKNMYMANILRSSALAGVSYNSPSTKNAICQILNQKAYNRKGVPMAYVQSSDFHNRDDQQIGVPRAYLTLDIINFSEIVKAFANPNELISSPEPKKIMDMIESIYKSPQNVCIPDISENSLELLRQTVCSYSNSYPGSILIGVHASKGPVGIDNSEETLKAILKKACIMVIPYPEVYFMLYPFGKKKIVSIRVAKGKESIYSSNEKVYLRKDNELVEATINDIVLEVERKTMQKFNGVLESNRRRLRKIETLLSRYSDGLEVMNYVNKILNQTALLSDWAEVKMLSVIESDPHGVFSKGTALVIEGETPPRVKGLVGRFSAPVKPVDINSIKDVQLVEYSGPKLIISSRGCVHYDDKDNIYIFTTSRPAIVFNIKSDKKTKISEKFLAGYLKSKALLYYVFLITDTLRLANPTTYKEMRIPTNIDNEKAIMVEMFVDEAMKLESDYLIKGENICKECQASGERNWHAELESIANEHNQKVLTVMEKIDKVVYEIFSLDEKTIALIEEKSPF